MFVGHVHGAILACKFYMVCLGVSVALILANLLMFGPRSALKVCYCYQYFAFVANLQAGFNTVSA